MTHTPQALQTYPSTGFLAAVRGYGLSLADIARALEVSKQSILRGLGKGEEVLRLKGWHLADLL